VKFNVLWLHTYFSGVMKEIDGEVKEDYKVVLEDQCVDSLEDALRLYNKLCADDTNQRVFIAVNIKEFKR